MVAQSAGAVEYTDCFSAEGWGWGVRPLPNECPGYDTKQSDGEAPVMLKLLGMQSTPSLLLLPGPLWPRLVPPDRVLSIFTNPSTWAGYHTRSIFKLSLTGLNSVFLLLD